MNICFFCSDPAEYGYEAGGDQRLWLCAGHWRLLGEFFIDAFEEADIIGRVEWLDD